MCGARLLAPTWVNRVVQYGVFLTCLGIKNAPYDPVADRFLVEGTDENSGELATIGSFHRYQIEELTQMATEIINN